ncbi:DNA mismatch repair endonuclease MutL [Candidatus Woesearchaeota archaeon]|nr:DNA mismatch repair endonuclease MutL [Candidatus Woesearchaeota archaeon]
MGKIQVLDDELVNKIAAGEVIERPASVVKELIENSIDAGASIITIELKEGGKSLIKVTDNGSGMSRDDVELSIMRHATSKISTADDLFNINSLGFRGEALASIAAVSNLKIITKQEDTLEGTKLLVSGSKILKLEPIGAPAGTTVEVSDLFFNTPARKKHLKIITTELNQITDIVTRYALIHPAISFKLIHDTKTIISSPATDDLLNNIVDIYGKDVAKNLIPVNHEKPKLSIKGFISKPQLSRASRDQQSIFVNNRYIKNKVITDALYDAYHTLLHLERHPVAILSIQIKPELVDVNVHPSKTEVRFSIENELYETIFTSVKEALASSDLIPESDPSETQSVLVQTDKPKQKKAEKIYESKPEQTALAEIKTVVKESPNIPELTILGLVHNCYILAEDKEGFLVIDMHAAEERCNYEKLMQQFKDKGIMTQELLSPVHFELTSVDASILKANLQLFDKFGFKIEDFGNNSFILRSAPLVIKRQLTKDSVLDIVDELRNSKFKTIEEIKEKIITRMACRKSVKQGERIEKAEMYKIIKELHSCELPYTCPHGRPTMIKFTKRDLEKRFKRVI